MPAPSPAKLQAIQGSLTVMSGSETAIRGDLQQKIMRILWQTESASVEEVRQNLPPGERGAYTTVQTVLNRLAERGLVTRDEEARAIQYSAKSSEADYLSRSLRQTLDGASDQARRTALANLVDDLESSEFEEIRAIAAKIQDRET
ncbi:MAG: BlaI/MecI/CopY family transcriptional regulator [Gemmatimonadetes bacterium]|jgi:predicted transcriptional regulator|nr:BlaI/MecI/CopY family transcriptional regulator [Gemmatimonadota bacterium]